MPTSTVAVTLPLGGVQTCAQPPTTPHPHLSRWATSGTQTARWVTPPMKAISPCLGPIMASSCRNIGGVPAVTSSSTSPSCILTAPLSNTSSLPICRQGTSAQSHPDPADQQLAHLQARETPQQWGPGTWASASRQAPGVEERTQPWGCLLSPCPHATEGWP